MNALPDDSERPGTVTGLQLDVLRALWRAGEATVTEVHAALQRRRRLAPTTVATLLKRLASKQLVEHRQEGRALVYRALIAEDEVVRRTVDEVAEQVFEGDVAAFAAQLLRRGDVNQGDLDRIRALIEARERELEG
ncbi:MAG: BlaI/MecI/CopY family transcriptional regulator [Planctomycetota bacterium]